MSNHSRYIREVLKPVCFLTFDSNTLWDKDSRLLSHSNVIPDDSGNAIPINGIMQSDTTDNRQSYLMGQPSLVPNMMTDSYSLILAPYGLDNTNKVYWTKSYIEVPHDDRIKFDGSFTIAFLLNASSNGVRGMQYYQWNTNTGAYVYNPNYYNYVTYTRTLARKGEAFGLYYNQPYYSNDYITINFPNNNGTIQASSIAGGLYDRSIYIVATHEIVNMDDGRYYTKSTLYFDNRIIYYNETSPIFGTYTAGNTNSLTIGGNQLPYDTATLNDRTTSPTIFDQFQVYNYALNLIQISYLYKKAFPFMDIIKRGFPTLYYPFNDTGTITYFNENISNNSTYGLTFIGSLTNQVTLNQTGVHGIYGTSCANFQNGAMLYCKPMYSYNTSALDFFNPSGDFTIEFFCSFNSYTRGVIFAIQDDTTPFRGITLFANSRFGATESGSLQLAIDEDTNIHTDEYAVNNTRINYNDGVVRHYAIVRRGNYVEFWINGVLIGKVFSNNNNITNNTNRLYMMGLMPSNLYVSGSLQHLALYTRSLTESELGIRINYLSEYIIDGRVTVQGNGQTVLLRIYNFNSGKLMLSQYTNADGTYRLRLPNDDYFNVVALVPSNTNIRPRTIGPTMADKYMDLPY